MYDLSPGITMRSTIPAYSYRHGLNFIPGIVKTRIDCYSGISYPSLIVMAPGVIYVHNTQILLPAPTQMSIRFFSVTTLLSYGAQSSPSSYLGLPGGSPKY